MKKMLITVGIAWFLAGAPVNAEDAEGDGEGVSVTSEAGASAKAEDVAGLLCRSLEDNPNPDNS